jgi:poly(3-hydroxybutyrate) depolymerase
MPISGSGPSPAPANSPAPSSRSTPRPAPPASDNGEIVTYKTSEFGDLDRAWLAAWAEKNAELDEIVKNAPGKLTRHEVKGEFTTEYYVYEPSEAGPEENRPVLLLFNPTAKAQQYIKRFVEPAEETKLTVITLGYFHNVSLHDPQVSVKEAPMTRRFGEVWQDIQRQLKFDKARVFLGGTSGGGRRAFSYTWQYPRPWAGVWNNGGWIGGPELASHDFPDNMRVVTINGNQDHANNAEIDHDTRALQKHGATVGIISFEGGHQMPPKDKIVQSFNWLLGKEDSYIEG